MRLKADDDMNYFNAYPFLSCAFHILRVVYFSFCAKLCSPLVLVAALMEVRTDYGLAGGGEEGRL